MLLAALGHARKRDASPSLSSRIAADAHLRRADGVHRGRQIWPVEREDCKVVAHGRAKPNAVARALLLGAISGSGEASGPLLLGRG